MYRLFVRLSDFAIWLDGGKQTFTTNKDKSLFATASLYGLHVDSAFHKTNVHRSPL